MKQLSITIRVYGVIINLNTLRLMHSACSYPVVLGKSGIDEGIIIGSHRMLKMVCKITHTTSLVLTLMPVDHAL